MSFMQMEYVFFQRLVPTSQLVLVDAVNLWVSSPVSESSYRHKQPVHPTYQFADQIK